MKLTKTEDRIEFLMIIGYGIICQIMFKETHPKCSPISQLRSNCRKLGHAQDKSKVAGPPALLDLQLSAS